MNRAGEVTGHKRRAHLSLPHTFCGGVARDSVHSVAEHMAIGLGTWDHESLMQNMYLICLPDR